MRSAITTVLEVAGLACLTAAAFTVGLSAGLAVGGVCLLVVGVLEGRK